MDNKKTMTKKEIKEWDKLYQYIKKNILQYDDNKKLPKWFVLRLKGLNQGKFCANNNIKSLGYYGFDVILLTFKIKKFDILIALKNKDKFKDEKHKINYMMTIIENNINDTYDRLKRLKKSETKGEEIEINKNDNVADYHKKTKEVTNSRLKGLL